MNQKRDEPPVGKTDPEIEPTEREPPRAGSINEPPGSNVLGKEVPGGGVIDPDAPPVLAMLDPPEAEIGAPDLVLACLGSNFMPDSVITFNGGDEATTFVNTTRVTTLVKPSLVTTAGDYPVTVRHAGGESDPATFTFTDPLMGDPDDMEDEIEQATEDGDIKRRGAPRRRR